MRRKILTLLALVAAFALVVGGATAVGQSPDRSPGIEATTVADPAANPVQYSVKFVCGFVQSDVEFGVKPGNYATAINIHNHTNALVRGGQRIALHYRPGGPLPPVQAKAGFFVRARRTVEIDCPYIWAHVGVPPHSYLKGMVHIGLDTQLPMAAVYTAEVTHDPQLPPDPGAGISIDVEYVDPFLVAAAG